ncbi:MAG: prepilin-type N-terminal cleavage/methylation protein [Oerskovia sp.]|nr:prepilin-type N-terminal cleavage/methylation protein [Oerskovia sp.]
MTAIAPPATRPALRARWREQRGIQLVELLIGMVIAGLTATIALSVLTSTGLLVTRSMATTTTLSQLEDASGLLLRDVNDGRKIVVAEPDALTVQVTRDSVCTQRAWTIDGDDLVVTTDTFSTERCTGGSETARMEVVQDTLTGATFHYYSALSQTNEMPSPAARSRSTRARRSRAAAPRRTARARCRTPPARCCRSPPRGSASTSRCWSGPTRPRS